MPVLNSCDPPQPSLKYVRSPRNVTIDAGERLIDWTFSPVTRMPVPVGTPRLIGASRWMLICGPAPRSCVSVLPPLLLYEPDAEKVRWLVQIEFSAPE